MALTKIGGYQVVSVLGEGPRGSVYLCRDRDDHRSAVRVFASTSDPEGFLKTAGALKALGEHHLALIEDFGIQEGKPFLATEFVKGEVLSVWLEDAHSLGDQLKLMEGLLEALNAAHAEGLVHGRVQPSNIHVLTDGECRLLDLGVSGLAEETKPAPSQYVAPELLEGGAASPKTDIYSTGIVCYEILAGRSPFDPASAGGGTQSLRTARPDLPRDLSDAVMACLDRDPEWRPKDLGYVLQVVKQLREAGLPKGARAPKPAPRAAAAAPAARSPRPRAPERSGPPLLPIALGVVALAGGGFWLWSRMSAPPPVGSRHGMATTSATPEPVTSSAPPPSPGASTATPATPAPKPSPTATLSAASALPTPPMPSPAATPVVASPSPSAAFVPTPAPAATAVPTPPPTPEPAKAVPTPAPEEPASPAVLTTVVPRVLKKGSTGIVDIHGLALRPEHQLRVWKGRDQATGFSVVRQRRLNETLIQAVLQVDAAAASGLYSLVVVDPRGGVSNLLPIEVAK